MKSAIPEKGVERQVVAIVQARMGSSRFPGKMLARLGGSPLLEWVLRRVLQAREIGSVCLATSTNACDDELEKLAINLDVGVCRGDEHDVLGRFEQAAKQSGADAIVRVCADNPFIAPEEIDRLVRFFVSKNADYAFNHQDRLGSRYADGFGAEILRRDILDDIASKARDPRHREHVTLYLWDNAADYRMLAAPAPQELAYPELCFDVDTPEDLEYLKTLVSAGVSFQTEAAEIVRLTRATSGKAGHE